MPSCPFVASRSSLLQDRLVCKLLMFNDFSGLVGVGSASATLALCALVGACGEEQEAVEEAVEVEAGEPFSLIDQDRWSPVVIDPFDDRPADAECPLEAIGPEDLGGERVFGVDTGFCHYITVEQLTQQAVRAGDEITVRVWHFSMTPRETTHVHAAVRVGQELWERQVPIESQSEMLTGSWTASADIPAGERIYFHVHNHGLNEWALVDVLAAPRSQ